MICATDKRHGVIARRRTAGLRFAAALCAVIGLAEPAGASSLRPGSPPPVPLDGAFELFIGGVKAADLSIKSRIGADDYQAEARVITAGFVGSLYEAWVEARVEGSLTPAALGQPVGGLLALVPRHFQSKTVNPRKDRQVEMRYRNGAPEVRAEPEYDDKPWAIDPADQAGRLDPVSAILAGLAPSEEAHLCDRRVEIFDARRHFSITLGPAGEPNASGEIRCHGEYARLSGFKPKMMAKPNIEVDVYFRPREDGLWHLERIMGDTPVGTAVIRRSKS